MAAICKMMVQREKSEVPNSSKSEDVPSLNYEVTHKMHSNILILNEIATRSWSGCTVCTRSYWRTRQLLTSYSTSAFAKCRRSHFPIPQHSNLSKLRKKNNNG